MMYQETKFQYKHFPDDKVQLLEMPYRGDDITMVIILPSTGNPLSQVILTAATSPTNLTFTLDLQFNQTEQSSWISFVFVHFCSGFQVEENLDLKKLNGWLSQMKETTVSVSVPRFRVEDNLSLKEKLREMGLMDLFDASKASLPGGST